MTHFKHVVLGHLLCLITFVWTGTIANPLGLNSQPPQSVSGLTHIVEDVAQGLGYRSMRGIRIPDQWAEGERQGWLVDHAYLTLFGKDSDDSCLRINGRIGATILSFKDRETIERQLAKTKENHAGNIGYRVIREDHDGYLVEEVNGLYAAVIAEGDLLLLEDRSRLQKQTIIAIADAVARKAR
jgi:hypothetical protein